MRLRLGTESVRPDIVFTKRRVAVFVDGCFWHSCPVHGVAPKKNLAYWEPKLAGNRERDARNTQTLVGAGWIVVRVWEHENPQEAFQRVADAVATRAICAG
jgi:DNA mismatch endonuclease (patch repair protein)